jgi:hypothetical protein
MGSRSYEAVKILWCSLFPSDDANDDGHANDVLYNVRIQDSGLTHPG